MTVTPDDDLPCRELVELVTEHLEGALDPDSEQRLLHHLTECGGCEAYVEQMRVTASLAGELRAEVVPPGLQEALLETYRGQVRPA